MLVAFPRLYLYWPLINSFLRSSNPTMMTPSFVPQHTVCNLFAVCTSSRINAKLVVIREQLANYLPVYGNRKTVELTCLTW